jgi:hypothetical protein
VVAARLLVNAETEDDEDYNEKGRLKLYDRMLISSFIYKLNPTQPVKRRFSYLFQLYRTLRPCHPPCVRQSLDWSSHFNTENLFIGISAGIYID